jgi:hypothetical protein
MERNAHLQSLFYITFRAPVKEPPCSFPYRAPIERDAPFPEPSFKNLSEFPVNGLPHPPRRLNGAVMA